MQIHWTKVKQIIEETNDIKTYLLDVPDDFTWEEGAFTHIGLKGFNEGEKPNRDLVRHMSICTLPAERTIGFTTRIRKERSEFKDRLEKHKVGDEIALFKTHCNVPLRRENRDVYLLSSGVGLATFRPLVLEYLNNPTDISRVHSLNIDSQEASLFNDIFTSSEAKRFTSQTVNNRPTYYNQVKELAKNTDGIFYIVGSDTFLKENITVLMEHGITKEQIMLDKRANQLPTFFSTTEKTI